MIEPVTLMIASSSASSPPTNRPATLVRLSACQTRLPCKSASPRCTSVKLFFAWVAGLVPVAVVRVWKMSPMPVAARVCEVFEVKAPSSADAASLTSP
jgi:hypothetical protein